MRVQDVFRFADGRTVLVGTPIDGPVIDGDACLEIDGTVVQRLTDVTPEFPHPPRPGVVACSTRSPLELDRETCARQPVLLRRCP
jgi:hypothetical protein